MDILFPADEKNEATRAEALALFSGLDGAPETEKLVPVCWLPGQAALAVHFGHVPSVKADMAAVHLAGPELDDEKRAALINAAYDVLESTVGRADENPVHGLILTDQGPGPHPAIEADTDLRLLGFTGTGNALRVRWFPNPNKATPGVFTGEIVNVWRRPESRAERDAAIEMWKAEGALPAGVDGTERANDLVMVAMEDGKAVGVSTAYIDHFAQIRSNMGVLRVFVADASRGAMLKTHLLLGAFEALQDWAKQNPEEGLKGILMVFQNARGLERYKDMPRPTRTVKADRIGLDAKDRFVTVRWFKDAVID